MKSNGVKNSLRQHEVTLLMAAALVSACSSSSEDRATLPENPTSSSALPSGNQTPAGTGMTNPAGSSSAGMQSSIPDNAPAAGSGNGNPEVVVPSMLNGPNAAGDGMGANTATGAGGNSAMGAGGAAGAATGTAGSAQMPPPADCPSPALTAGDSTKTVNVGGANRTYILHVPTTYAGNEPAPLLMDFHGLGGSQQGERNSSSYVAATQSDGVVLAFPQGLSDGTGPGWNVGPCCVDNVDDVAFTRAMVAQIQQVACIDAKRIYAVGFSNGAGLSYKLACDATDLVAAVAPASFDFGTENVNDCKPSRPISTIAQRGTSDPAVPFNGGTTTVGRHSEAFIGAQATFDKWKALDGCTGPEQDIGNNCKKVSQCSGGVENTLCVIQGGGHQPGDANVLWPLLRQYSMP